jgi:hypothetical protein
VNESDLTAQLEAINAATIQLTAKAKLKLEPTDRFPDAPKYDPEKPELVETSAREFFNNTPAFHPCAENFQTLAAFMAHHNLAASASCWTLAFDALNKQGLMIPVSGQVPEKRVESWTMKEIDALPSELYKRKLISEPRFRQRVEDLLAGKA